MKWIQGVLTLWKLSQKLGIMTRCDWIIATVYMENVALMLSMVTLLGFATNNTQISPGLTLKNPTAKWAGREL